MPNPLPDRTPTLGVRTFNAVANARAALAALDASARQLPNPALLRQPTLRQEAQSTSALEGTYAPLEEVLGVDTDSSPARRNDLWPTFHRARSARCPAALSTAYRPELEWFTGTLRNRDNTVPRPGDISGMEFILVALAAGYIAITQFLDGAAQALGSAGL
ncbi:Fic/DOC family N-terminal domain-containing protein [Nocardia speluncae]|uniref:Fic/DOC family N-terminal domain-containing protein n=1 Tax=Nocardia speluncae TaxID=419477 RepID=UPI0008310B12|nr:Fic/DOC family N-terminal domain-containing protein [Nocardia speluncae]